jgi:hypothetical protein
VPKAEPAAGAPAAAVLHLGLLTGGLLPLRPLLQVAARTQDVAPFSDVLQFGGPISALTQAPDGRWVYAGMGARLAVIDAADPANPRLTVLLPLGQPPTAMVLAAHRVVGAAQADPEDQQDLLGQEFPPADPETMGQFESPPLLYVAAGTAGVAVLSVAQPEAPELLGWIDTDWFAYDIALDAAQGRLVVADGGAGLAVFDVRDPGAPVALGTVDTPSEARAVVLDPSARLAYVADWGRGLAVIDLGDAAAPRLLGGVDSPGEAVDVALDAGWIDLADREGGLALVEVGDPTAPRLAASVSSAVTGAPEALFVDGDAGRVYLADGAGGNLRWLRRTAPGVLADGGVLALGGQPVAMERGVGRRLAVANARVGLQLLDAGDGVGAVDPRQLGLLFSPSFVEGVALDPRRGLAFLADAYGGVLSLDPGSAGLPRVVGRLFTSAATHDLALDGDRAYVADSSAGEALGVDLDRDAKRAYLADGPGGLRIYDVSTAGADGPPQLLGELPLAGFAWSLRADPAARLVYLADRLVGLRVIDVSDPANPRERAVYTAAGGVFEVALSGHRAYIAAGQGGLRVVDVSDPDRPRDVGGAPGLGAAQGLALFGGRLFVTAGAEGLRRLDLRDPDRPRPVAAWALEGLTERIDIEPGAAGALGRVFVACEMGGLAIVAPEAEVAERLYLPSVSDAAR